MRLVILVAEPRIHSSFQESLRNVIELLVLEQLRDAVDEVEGGMKPVRFGTRVADEPLPVEILS